MSILFSLLMYGNSVCGTPPWAKPVYCSKGSYICICDDNGDCDWQLVCE